mmetsp:Transcript_12628/g.30741  ORF Transcript_12628/g.30741 Transcript_12628/m.30741 type:complete len:207 (+) Transcript_12628:235-855(+)
MLTAPTLATAAATRLHHQDSRPCRHLHRPPHPPGRPVRGPLQLHYFPNGVHAGGGDKHHYFLHARGVHLHPPQEDEQHAPLPSSVPSTTAGFLPARFSEKVLVFRTAPAGTSFSEAPPAVPRSSPRVLPGPGSRFALRETCGSAASAGCARRFFSLSPRRKTNRSAGRSAWSGHCSVPRSTTRPISFWSPGRTVCSFGKAECGRGP